MPALDRFKEEIAYLKFWQGVAVVTGISLSGWLMSAVGNAHGAIVVLAVIGIGLLGAVILTLHRYIERRIEEIGKL